MFLQKKVDEIFMRRCLDLALLGQSKVAPNPMVGSVLVFENKIISEGYHKKMGSVHAEIDCFNNLKPEFKNSDVLSNSTLYVSLEPCVHKGKTPPCVDKIIELGIQNVVVSCVDINPIVSGKGVKKLLDAGIKVRVGVLDKENKELNKRFFCFYQNKRPYIILKWAESFDGFVAKKNFDRVNISNEYSSFINHIWRDQESSIMLGTNSVKFDNPHLTTRIFEGKNSIRIFIDKSLSVPMSYNIYNSDLDVIVFNNLKNDIIGNCNFIKINFEENVITSILKHLYNLNISSVIVEGGPYLINQFVKHGFWDEARKIKSSSVNIVEGITAPTLKNFTLEKQLDLRGDSLFYLKNTVEAKCPELESNQHIM